MKNRTIPGLLLLGVSTWGVTANAAQSAITCDRECLRGKVTQLLYAIVKHDVSKLPVSDTLRVTEDAVEKPLKEAIWDCRMCGQCILHSTGLSCPMRCPKNLRNGPCGGVRANGNCEVYADKRCTWVEAWEGVPDTPRTAGDFAWRSAVLAARPQVAGTTAAGS